jgi:uncharacterized protein YigA (DUF484 family)
LRERSRPKKTHIIKAKNEYHNKYQKKGSILRGRHPRGRTTKTEEEEEKRICAYLRANPDFFVRHVGLLSEMELPGRPSGDGVVDFQRFLVERLRSELSWFVRTHETLVTLAKANLKNQDRVHAAALFALDATSLDHLLQIILTDFAVMLEVDSVGLVLEAIRGRVSPLNLGGIKTVSATTLERFLVGEKVVLRQVSRGEAVLYGEAAGKIRSEMLLRLDLQASLWGNGMGVGVLALGSHDPHFFAPGQGTEQAVFLAQIASRCLSGWLDAEYFPGG